MEYKYINVIKVMFDVAFEKLEAFFKAQKLFLKVFE